MLSHVIEWSVAYKLWVGLNSRDHSSMRLTGGFLTLFPGLIYRKNLKIKWENPMYTSLTFREKVRYKYYNKYTHNPTTLYSFTTEEQPSGLRHLEDFSASPLRACKLQLVKLNIQLKNFTGRNFCCLWLLRLITH